MKLTLLSIFLFTSSVFAKPFHRVLVIAGGGIDPGVSLGIIHGAEAAGFKPDLIISVCGAMLGATISHAYPNPKQALDYVRSVTYQRKLLSLAQIETRNALDLKFKLDDANENPNRLQNFFSGNILRIPEKIPPLFRNEDFPVTPGQPRHIFLSARANFGPQHVGANITGRNLYTEVFATDPQTAQILKRINFKSAIKAEFPKSHIFPNTEVLVGVSMSQATRAGISDPHLINPGKIGDHYYLTGAIDLFPIELARELGDEILIPYPEAPFDKYSEIAIQTSFGFSPNARLRHVAKATDMKWIDMLGKDEVTFDPGPLGFIIVSNIPDNADEFYARVDQQYAFGYNRTLEALKLQRNRKNVRSHLRSNLLTDPPKFSLF